MSKITLSTVSELQTFPSAAANINSNSDTIETAFDNTLSRDGTSPNTMGAVLDMNSFNIVNLPAPSTSTSPLRLQELLDFTGSGSVTLLPVGGTTGQALKKNSNTNYDVGWGNIVSSVGLSMPADFSITNSPVTGSGTLTAAYATPPTGTGAFVKTASPTITSPTLVTPVLGTPTSGTLTNATGLPVSTGISGLGSGIATFLATPTSANLASAVTDETGGGVLVFSGSPTILIPNITGTTAAGNATAGSIGEYIESNIAAGSSVALTTAVTSNVTSISLTAGDWDVEGAVTFNPAATTSITAILAGISLTSVTFDGGPAYSHRTAAFVPALPLGGYGLTRRRVNVSSTTTVFLVAQSTFTVSTNAAFGYINARRVR